MDDVSGITFWVDDSSVLELKKTGVADKRRYTEGKGILCLYNILKKNMLPIFII